MHYSGSIETKEDSQLKEKVLFIPIFDRVLTVIIGDFGSLSSYMKTTHNIDLAPCLGAYACVDDCHYLLLTSNATLAVLLHELSHATFGIIDRIGADPSDQELFCYLQGFLIQQVLTLIDSDLTKQLDTCLVHSQK